VNRVISRQTLITIIISLILVILVMLFAFLMLIPQGKEYRQLRLDNKKEIISMMQLEIHHENIYKQLKELQSENRHIINGFVNPFTADDFLLENSKFFESLTLSRLKTAGSKEEFDLYEVNTTSKISSPQSFYDFLENINKSSWIIGVNLPIFFDRDDNLIKTTFTMRVYKARADSPSVTAN
jgi:amino acid permease